MNNTKLNKYVVIIAAICTIIPFNVIIESKAMNYTLLYVPMIIGYMLYYMQYKSYSNKQKELLNIATCISTVNLLAGIWINFTSMDLFSDSGVYILIATFLFYISYFVHRIVSLILCIKLLKDSWGK